jgi:hypothetical protein
MNHIDEAKRLIEEELAKAEDDQFPADNLELAIMHSAVAIAEQLRARNLIAYMDLTQAPAEMTGWPPEAVERFLADWEASRLVIREAIGLPDNGPPIHVRRPAEGSGSKAAGL